MSDDVPSVKRLPLPGSHGSVRPSAPAPSSVPVSQSAGTATAHDSESVNDDDWDAPSPESSEHASVSSTPSSQMPESSQRTVEAGSSPEPSQPPDSVERPSDPSRTPTVRVSTRPQAIDQTEAGSFNGLKEGLARGTDDRTTLMGIAPFGPSSSPPTRPVSSTPPPPTPSPSNRPYQWPTLPPEVVAAQKALAARARAEGAVRDEEPAKTEPGAEPGEPRDEASNETAPKAPEVTKQEAIRAAGEQTTPPRNRRVATTDDAAFDASDRSSAPKPSRNSKPKVVIAAAAMLGVAGLWAALQSSGTKSSREAESVAVSKAVTQAAPAKAPEPVNQQIAQPVQQAVPAMEPPQPPAPAPQPVSAELPAQPERAAAAATQAPAPEEPTSGGPTTRVVIRSKTKGAKFYRYGKEVGTDEITVDLPVGEKRAFELGLPGHATRKVVVDGSSTVIELGLRKIEGKPGSHTPSDL